MRHEAAFLRDILNAASKIQTIIAAATEQSFLNEKHISHYGWR